AGSGGRSTRTSSPGPSPAMVVSTLTPGAPDACGTTSVTLEPAETSVRRATPVESVRAVPSRVPSGLLNATSTEATGGPDGQGCTVTATGPVFGTAPSSSGTTS